VIFPSQHFSATNLHFLSVCHCCRYLNSIAFFLSFWWVPAVLCEGGFPAGDAIFGAI
jgi:hypothetical protein